jgi:hypothetical protein
MPQMVQYTVPARAVKEGNLLVSHVEEPVTVGHVEVKTKYTTIYAGAESVRLPNEAEVIIHREEQTEEEKAAAEAEYVLKTITERMQKAPRLVEVAKKGVLDAVENGWASKQMAAVADLITAETQAQLWKDVQKIADNRHITVVDATRMLRDDMMRKMIDYGIRLTNVSTSMVSNTANAVELEAKVEWLRDMKWILLDS